MSRPHRHFGSSPSLNRSLSRLSSSSSFQVRQSNSRIYTFLVAGGLVLFATVAILQIWAPQGSKLSPLQHGKSSDEGEQAWWKENIGEDSTRDRERLDPATGKGVANANSKLGRRMGAMQSESSEEDIKAKDEEVGDNEDDEDVEQDLFDADIDDRLLEEEAEEDLEAEDLKILTDMANEEGSAEGLATQNLAAIQQSVYNACVVTTGISESELTVASVGGLGKNEKQGKGNLLPDWVLDKKLWGDGLASTLDRGFETDLVKDLENRKGSFFWNHALGIPKRSTLENVEPLESVGEAKASGNVDLKHLAARDKDAATVAFVQLRGFKEVVQNWRERFNSDDELVDENVEERLEGVHEIEDALLLNSNGDAAPSKNVSGYLKKGRDRASLDALNPSNNPMLQDPDTDAGTWMTKTDKEMLRAIRGSGQQAKAFLRGSNILNDGTVTNSVGSRAGERREEKGSFS